MDGQDDDIPEVRSRIPLMPRRSPPRTPQKQIRRKSSFIRRVDSSEESPSPHNSIFEALYQSTTNSDDSGHVDSWPPKPLPASNQSTSPRSDTRENNENTRKSPTATNTITNDNQFLYGRGTVLETITERTSLGSIRILARAKSADDLHAVPFSVHQGSFIPGQRPQRKKSRSLDEINLNNDHQDSTLVERKFETPLAIHEIYAQPKAPIKEPPPRPQTPPGMPSWTEYQLRPPQMRRGRRTSTGLRQLFGVRSSSMPPEQALPNGGRSVSAPVGGRAPRIARYRPPRSAYSRIDQHPFNNAPAAIVDPFLQQHISPRPTSKRKSVRFTPSTVAQDSEAVHLQTRTAPPGPPAAPHFIARVELLSPIQSTTSSPVTPQKKRECPHRKGQRTAFKRLKHSTSTITGIDYQAILSSPLTRNESHASLPRLLPPSPTHPMSSGWSGCGLSNWDMGIIDTETISGVASNSSTTHLMTGAIPAPSPSPTPEWTRPDGFALLHPSAKNRCWRCRLENLGEKLAKFRDKCVRCFWFVCCGFDPDDDGSTYAPRNVRMEFNGQVRDLGDERRAMDRRWGRAENSPSPARTRVTDSLHHRAA